MRRIETNDFIPSAEIIDLWFEMKEFSKCLTRLVIHATNGECRLWRHIYKYLKEVSSSRLFLGFKGWNGMSTETCFLHVLTRAHFDKGLWQGKIRPCSRFETLNRTSTIYEITLRKRLAVVHVHRSSQKQRRNETFVWTLAVINCRIVYGLHLYVCNKYELLTLRFIIRQLQVANSTSIATYRQWPYIYICKINIPQL